MYYIIRLDDPLPNTVVVVHDLSLFLAVVGADCHLPSSSAMEVCMRVPFSGSPSMVTLHPQGLLDFSKEFDVPLLDKVAMAFYTGRGQEVCL